MSVLANLLEKRDKTQAKLDELVASLRDEESGEDRALTADEAETSKKLLEKRARLDERIATESKETATQHMLAEARKNAGLHVETRRDGNGADMSVESESKVYGFGSSNSYFADLYYTNPTYNAPGTPMFQAAAQRQAEWSNQVEHEIADGTKFGRFAEKQFREHYRGPSASPDAPGGVDWRAILKEARSRGRVGLSDKGLPGVEARALTTGGGATASASGGGTAAFVTPIFTEGDYVPFRQFGRVFADSCTSRPLPTYGMAVYMPQVTAAAAVSTSYSETSAVTESDPAQGYITAALIIIPGQVTTSQAVLDRTGPNFEYDVVIWDQLERDYALQFDTYVLTQALANAHSQAWTGNGGVFELVPPSASLPGSGGFVGQVAKAAAYMETLAGTVLSPSHLFMVPARWRFISAWADAEGRPVVVPNIAGPFNAYAAGSPQGSPRPEGDTGYMLGGLPVLTDQNIPTTTTANLDQAIVCDPSQAWVYEGAPVHRVLPQTLAGNLEVIFQQFSYATVLVRFTGAFVNINGTGMSAISYNG